MKWWEGPTVEELKAERFGGPVSVGEPHCCYCMKTLNPSASDVYRKVTGWERNRGTGQGVHPIKDRELLGHFAHALCLDIALRGGKQEAMFG